MKTKLTLNIDDSVVAKAKKNAARKRKSLSSLIEEYLNSIGTASPEKKSGSSALTGRIRKLTRRVRLNPAATKKQWHKHIDKKYGH